MVHADGRQVELRPNGAVAITTTRDGSAVVLQTAEAPTGADVRLRADFVHELCISAVGSAQLRTASSYAATRYVGEHQQRAEALADITVHDDGKVGQARLDAGGAAEGGGCCPACVRIRCTLPQTARPERVCVLAGLLAIREFRFHAGNLCELEGTCTEDAGLEYTNRELRLTRLGAVRYLRHEVGVDVTVPDAAESSPAALRGTGADP